MQMPLHYMVSAHQDKNEVTRMNVVRPLLVFLEFG